MRRAAEHLEGEVPDPLLAAMEYGSAHAAMPPEVQVDELGRYAVSEAVHLYYERVWPVTRDLAHLRACEALAQRYLEGLAEARAAGLTASEPNADEEYIRTTLQAVRAELEAAEAETAEPRAEPLASKPLPRPAPDPAPPVEQARRDPLALGMISVGTVLGLGGAVLAVDGLLFPSMIAEAKAKQRALDEMEGDLAPGDPDPRIYEEHEERMRRRGNALLIGGIASFAAGAALVVWGNLRVLRKRSRSSVATLRIAPRLGREGAGMSVSLRF